VIDAVGAVGSVVVVVVLLEVINLVGAWVVVQPVPAVIVWPLVVDVVKTALAPAPIRPRVAMQTTPTSATERSFMSSCSCRPGGRD
jgi:hypothetical protein